MIYTVKLAGYPGSTRIFMDLEAMLAYLRNVADVTTEVAITVRQALAKGTE